MHPYSFSVSLRANHPTDDLSYLTTLLGFPPRHQWKAGDVRATPKGTVLGGVRSKSYWTTRLTKEDVVSEEFQLEDFLNQTLDDLSPHKDSLRTFATSGGGFLNFFVSLYGARNFGIIFTPGFMTRLASFQVELQLDIYPTAK